MITLIVTHDGALEHGLGLEMEMGKGMGIEMKLGME